MARDMVPTLNPYESPESPPEPAPVRRGGRKARKGLITGWFLVDLETLDQAETFPVSAGNRVADLVVALVFVVLLMQ